MKRRRWSEIKKEAEVNLPLEARNLFVRRYNQVFNRTGDIKTSKNAAMSLVKTRFKKDGSKWIPKTRLKK